MSIRYILTTVESEETSAIHANSPVSSLRTHRDRAEFKRRRDHGLKARHAKRLERWIPVDEFLKRYDEQRDPNGHYGTPGRDPQNILTLKDAS